MNDRYEVLLADPPWQHSSTRGPGARRAAERQYATMSTAEICALDPAVNRVTAPIARLFLWCTDSMLLDALQVMQAWGFRYTKVAFVWVKLTKSTIAPHQELTVDHAVTRYGKRGFTFGAGRTTRNGAELCLLGSRGRMDVANRSQRQVILAAVREHSRKPAEQYERIEALYPGRHYLELFARHRRPGWAAHGDELLTRAQKKGCAQR